MSSQPLLQPIKIGAIPLKNRVVMAPMTRSRANTTGNIPTEALQGVYYQQRASAGLIISEGSQVSPQAVGYIHTPGIYSQAQVEGWKKVTEMVHAADGKIFIQLWHVGRISHPDFHNGELPVSASAINPHTKSFTPQGFKDTVTPKALTLAEIKNTVQDFKNAAKNAMEAGFDGIEIHSSNGYLFHQFFSASTNVRSDMYGGSIENRARFLFKVLEAIQEVMPLNRVGVRLNPSAHKLFGITVDEQTIPTFDYIVTKLNEYDLAYLHLSEPFTDVSDEPFAIQEVAKHYRPMYHGNLMINSNFDQEKGNKIIDEGTADMVAYGKLFISNPDLVERFETNSPLAPWDKETFYTTGTKGYTDYPSLK